MKRWGSATAYLLLAIGLIIALAGGALAQSGYDLSWWTVDGGGQTFPGLAATAKEAVLRRTDSTGPGYSLGGTVGQPDAGVMSGPGYMLDGGFWPGGVVAYRVYLPLIVRNY